MLGDLSGFPYNALIVKGGTVTVAVTDPKGNPLQCPLFVTVIDPNGNQIAEAIGSTLSTGTGVVQLNVALNVSYTYHVYVGCLVPGNADDPVGLVIGSAQLNVLGSALYTGIPVAIATNAWSTGLSIQVQTLIDGVPAPPGIPVTVFVNGPNGVQIIPPTTVTTSAPGVNEVQATLNFPNSQYLAGDTYTVTLSQEEVQTGYLGGPATVTVTGETFLKGPVLVQLNLTKPGSPGPVGS